MPGQIPLELQSAAFGFFLGKMLEFPSYVYQRTIAVPRRRTAQAAAVKAHLANIANLVAEEDNADKKEEAELRPSSPTPSDESELSSSVVSYECDFDSLLASRSFKSKTSASSTPSALSLTKIAPVQLLKASASTKLSKVTAQATLCGATTGSRLRLLARCEALARKTDKYGLVLEVKDLEDAQTLTVESIEARMAGWN